MFNVTSLSTGTFPYGSRIGLPCFLIEFDSSGNETDPNEIYDLVKKSGIKLVALRTSIVDNPEVVDLVRGFTSVGIDTVFLVRGDDSIEPIRHIRRTSVVVTITPPTESQNQINGKNLPLLREDDEIRFKIHDEAEYDAAKDFLKSKVISRPTVVFDFRGDSREMFLATYLHDVAKFPFPSRAI